MREITNEHVEAAFILDAEHAAIEEGDTCLACGDDLEGGQQALDVFDPAFDAGSFRAIITIHLTCYQGEEIVA